MKFAVIAALVLAVPAPAQTASEAEHRYSRTYRSCINTGDAALGMTQAIVECAADEFKRQDANLNRIYRVAIAGQSGAGMRRLRNQQRAWIARRDARCAPARSGTIDRINRTLCMLSETTKRTIWLERRRG